MLQNIKQIKAGLNKIKIKYHNLLWRLINNSCLKLLCFRKEWLVINQDEKLLFKIVFIKSIWVLIMWSNIHSKVMFADQSNSYHILSHKTQGSLYVCICVQERERRQPSHKNLNSLKGLINRIFFSPAKEKRINTISHITNINYIQTQINIMNCKSQIIRNCTIKIDKTCYRWTEFSKTFWCSGLKYP